MLVIDGIITKIKRPPFKTKREDKYFTLEIEYKDVKTDELKDFTLLFDNIFVAKGTKIGDPIKGYVEENEQSNSIN